MNLLISVAYGCINNWWQQTKTLDSFSLKQNKLIENLLDKPFQPISTIFHFLIKLFSIGLNYLLPGFLVIIGPTEMEGPTLIELDTLLNKDRSR